MKMNKKIIIAIIIILLIIISIVIGLKLNKKSEVTDKDNDENEGLTGLIENEKYYYEKQKVYSKKVDEYEDLVAKYSNEKFTEEEKNTIEDYRRRMSEADKETKKKLSNEYTKLYEEYMEKEFSQEQLEEVRKINETIEQLEPIVNEYQELIAKAEEAKSKEGLVILEDGKIQNNKENIVSEKEYEGLKFNDIKLIYDTKEESSTISMKITNTTNEAKGNKLITLSFTGNTESKFPMKIEEISEGEYIEEKIPIPIDLTDASNLEIIDFNEKDYK